MSTEVFALPIVLQQPLQFVRKLILCVCKLFNAKCPILFPQSKSEASTCVINTNHNIKIYTVKKTVKIYLTDFDCTVNFQ